jgi:hypothetical protein
MTHKKARSDKKSFNGKCHHCGIPNHEKLDCQKNKKEFEKANMATVVKKMNEQTSLTWYLKKKPPGYTSNHQRNSHTRQAIKNDVNRKLRREGHAMFDMETI